MILLKLVKLIYSKHQLNYLTHPKRTNNNLVHTKTESNYFVNNSLTWVLVISFCLVKIMFDIGFYTSIF